MASSTWSRRRLLQVAGGATVALPLAGLTGCGGAKATPYRPAFRGVIEDGQTGARLTSEYPLPPSFSQPMKLPPVAQALCGADGTTTYSVVAREASQEILPGIATTIWGYDGTFPGPTIESMRGCTTVVKLRNELPVPIVRHFHGALTPSPSDGYPIDYVLPVAGWPHPLGMAGMDGRISHGEKTYTYPLRQQAATLWYHDHRMDFTGPQVVRGLVGMHLHRDAHEESLGLPSGPYELPLVITDRSFGKDGSMLYPSLDPTLTKQPGVLSAFSSGVLGDTILVNGRQAPWHEVEPTTYRLRVVNASTARRYRLSLDPTPSTATAFTIIGTDGGFVDAPLMYDSFLISQAERFDVVVDFSVFAPGTNVTLRNLDGSGRQAEVMQFRVRGTASTPPWRAPARIAPVPKLDPAQATRTRQFVFTRAPGAQADAFTIAGMTFDPMTVAADPKQGSTEIWELSSDLPHPVHIHNVHFQVLDGLDPVWKDVVSLPSIGKARIIVKFTSYKGRYIFHCHNLEHEDMGMMARFDII